MKLRDEERDEAPACGMPKWRCGEPAGADRDEPERKPAVRGASVGGFALRCRAAGLFFVRRGVMASLMPAVGQKEAPMKEVEQLVAELKQLRDEIALRVHLASMEIHQDWNKLERDWSQFKTRAALDETAEGVSEALGQVGQELRAGYRRIRKALEED